MPLYLILSVHTGRAICSRAWVGLTLPRSSHNSYFHSLPCDARLDRLCKSGVGDVCCSLANMEMVRKSVLTLCPQVFLSRGARAHAPKSGGDGNIGNRAANRAQSELLLLQFNLNDNANHSVQGHVTMLLNSTPLISHIDSLSRPDFVPQSEIGKRRRTA